VSLYTYGVTASDVRKHHFPNSDDFSTTTNPTLATVTEKIDDAAGELAARLLKEAVDPQTVNAGGATYAPYVVLRNVLRKMVAVEIGPAIGDSDSTALTRWQKDLDTFFARLEDDAGTALGDDTLSTSASEPDGPVTHIDEYGLDYGDPATDASDVIPPFRKDDEL
jgi:hypothetical protein